MGGGATGVATAIYYLVTRNTAAPSSGGAVRPRFEASTVITPQGGAGTATFRF